MLVFVEVIFRYGKRKLTIIKGTTEKKDAHVNLEEILSFPRFTQSESSSFTKSFALPVILAIVEWKKSGSENEKKENIYR